MEDLSFVVKLYLVSPRHLRQINIFLFAILNLFSLLGWGIDAITDSLKVPDTRFYTVTLDKKE